MKSYRNNLGSAIQTATEKYPFLLYVLLAMVVFWPLTFGGHSLQYDAVDVYMPWRFFGSESLRQGMVPLWNPFQDGGYPFYADHQYSIWNPELFIVSLFTRYNATVIVWIFLIYISLGALGFRFLLKQLKLNKSVWFIGGVLFMLSGIIIGHAQSIISILGAIWLPWAIGMYLKALDNDFRLKDTLGLVVTMFLMLAGGYQAVSIMLFYLLIGLGSVHFIRLLRAKNRQGIRRFLLGHLLTGAILFVLMLGVVLSLTEVYPYLSRLAGLTLEESQLVHFHPKALWSVFYPLASIQEEYRGTSATAQNIFSGILFFFALYYGLRKLRPHLSAHLIVLLAFGLLYGLAALGPNTPIQPFFYHYVPGCDQFFYAAFFRYFTWIALLIVACIGLQHIVEKQNYTPLLWFLLAALGFYIISAAVAWEGWDGMVQALETQWFLSFRKMGWQSAQLMQSLLHSGILLLFALVLLWKKSIRWVLPFIVIELALIAQLNIPATVHGEHRAATLDRHLETMKEGFFRPSNEVTLGDNDAHGIYANIWRNQGNFENLPCLNAYSSFHLVGRYEVFKAQDSLTQLLPTKSLVYLSQGNEKVKITTFKPGALSLIVPDQSGGMMVVQQANYPGWMAKVDGRPAKIETVNRFEQGILLSPGPHKVELRFENKKISALFYITQYGFLVVLFLYWTLGLQIRSSVQRGLAFSLVFGVILIRQLSFSEAAPQEVSLTSDTEKLHFQGQLMAMDYEQIWALGEKSKELELKSTCDDDPILWGLLNHCYEKIENAEENTWRYSRRVKSDTVQHVIPAQGFSDIQVPAVEGGTWLLYSMDMKQDQDFSNIFVVIETKEMERIVYAAIVPLKTVLAQGEKSMYANGYLLPDLSGGRSVKMYFWNNSSGSFSFSNFRLGIIP